MKNPSGYCMCGCGRRTPLSDRSARGYKRGEPMCFIRGHSSRKTGPDYIVEDRGHTDWEQAGEFDAGPPSSCWIWQKSVGSEGYGRIWIGDRHEMAHRVYYERHIGTIREGYELHHECGQRDCVNPYHLIEVTRAEHMTIEGRPPYGNPHAKVAA